jgi:NAD(P)-dependent dehydrogenase (short-subunit alcohol dehydrogenase family)
MKLANKVALITGAGSGMGRVASLLFAKEGAKVAAIDIDENAARETLRMIEAEGGKGLAVKADVSKSADAKAMVATTIEKLGGLNIVYNNAGIEGKAERIVDLAEEDFDRVIAINLRGVWLGMKYALPHMVKNGGGAIVNTASIAGLVGLRNSSAYCAAKAGVIAITKVAALEYGRYNIRVNRFVRAQSIRRWYRGYRAAARCRSAPSVASRRSAASASPRKSRRWRSSLRATTLPSQPAHLSLWMVVGPSANSRLGFENAIAIRIVS